MTTKSDDWNPRAEQVLDDPLHAYDRMRKQCPVAYSDYLQWSLFRHQDISQVLHDHNTFSSTVSAHVSVPNSMDPPEHTVYRAIIEPYFSPDAIQRFEPLCRNLANQLVRGLSKVAPFDCVAHLAEPYALDVQCAFLGWPEDKRDDLQRWMKRNQAAVLAGDRTDMAEVAEQFQDMVSDILANKRLSGATDVMGSLTRAEVHGRPLRDEEIISIVRNWTGGEVGTISAAIGIIIYFLVSRQDIQLTLRQHPEKIPEAIEEILRIHGPLLTNRRLATVPVVIGGRDIQAGERITLFWASANRDDSMFENALNFQWNRDQQKNLLYGSGIHICPGAPLARLELRLLVEELLAHTDQVISMQSEPPSHAAYPAGGFVKLLVSFAHP